ncbi:flagellar assembly protein FliH [Photobacterium gaetbulicola]|uniref:Flagellar assembly protein FliH n=1 Tax=Photobacterium gaetbulicola Gung47 TaxID=658445 RepID=A0A0C5X2H9_9GAMM|nr:flagellar assembly protein FliH [Photobacterium gaetbulicola]AJR09555.1 flagellar assembly protein H [Photobacterium gaetbulicola Gung47]PSU14348.1 flagellar assembly protein FliH [Photobacterium gaetbulicola]
MSTDRPLERRRGFLRVSEHQAQELERWAYPDYSPEHEGMAENALNYEPDWQVEPLDDEPELPPLTAADLDDIRHSAYEEGIAEGRAAGHSEGFEQGQQQGLEQGQQQGLEQGLAQGLAQGLEQGKAQIDEQVGYLTQLAEKLATPLQQVDDAVEQQLVQLVTSLARELVQVELKTNPQVILQTLREGIAALPMAGQQTTIQLHPDDLDIIKQAYGTENLAERHWTLQAEPALNRGDLFVESGNSTVDYQMENRLRHMLEQFVGLNSQPQPSPSNELGEG